jgi:DNA-binding MarR family transcriptional regulator
VRPVAESTLYPAIKRLEKAGLLVRATEPGAMAAPRHVLRLTEEGGRELKRRSAEPAQREITDENHWFTLLAFLRRLDDPAAQAAVLRRRLAFLEEPASFLYDGDRPLAARNWTTRSGTVSSPSRVPRAGRNWPGCATPWRHSTESAAETSRCRTGQPRTPGTGRVPRPATR